MINRTNVSLATAIRVGFGVSLLLILQALATRLAWRTNGLPFGVNWERSTGRFWVQDFAHIFGLTKAFMSGAIASPYDVHERLAFMAQWIGQPIDLALGTGYSPTMWLILAPLLPLPAAAAYVVWALVPALVLLVVGWRLTGRDEAERDTLAPTLILIALASGSYQGEIEVGKTVAVLGLIAVWLISACGASRSDLRPAVPLFLLTASPPMAIAMAIGLLWDGRMRPVALAGALVLVEVACVTWWLGSGWIGDYVGLLTHYDTDTAPESFRSFVAPRGMSNLRHLLVTFAGWSDRAASLTSVAAWAAAVACGTWLAVAGYVPAGRLRLALSLLLLTIFSPHLTFTNDLLVVAAVWFLQADTEIVGVLRIVAIVALVVVVNCGPFKTFFFSDAGADTAMLAKVVILVVFLVQSSRVRQATVAA